MIIELSVYFREGVIRKKTDRERERWGVKERDGGHKREGEHTQI